MTNFPLQPITRIARQGRTTDATRGVSVIIFSVLIIFVILQSAISQDKMAEEDVKNVDAVAAKGYYNASWESLEKF